MSDPSAAQELHAASKEVAAVLATAAARYSRLPDALAAPASFAEAKSQALGLSLLTSQAHCSALELVPEFRSSLPRESVPPLMAILLLGAIASSCTVIAACTAESIEGVTLLSAKRLQAILAGKEVGGWLSTMLS